MNWSQSHYSTLVLSGGWPALLFAFYVAGLALSLTPCCLPMVPIISGLIIRQTPRPTTLGAFGLAVCYVLGMSSIYAMGGVFFSAAGLELQAVFQTPLVISLFSGIFVLLAASTLGAFTLQMPSFLQTKFAALSARQSAGSFLGMLLMGALSALIVTACVAPAMVGALAIISRSGNVWRGGAALFSMGLGMGTPLILVGASAGRLLLRAGPWTNRVKELFAAVFIAIAVWLLGRIVPDAIERYLWTLPFFVIAFVLLRATPHRPSRGWPYILVVFLCMTVIVYLLAYRSPAPQKGALGARSARQAEVAQFKPISSLHQLDLVLAHSALIKKPVIVDFWANWCTSCKEMDATTFASAAVKAQLSKFLLYRVDLTQYTSADRRLLAHFSVYGPPTLLVFGPNGQELIKDRVIGYMPAETFEARLHKITNKLR